MNNIISKIVLGIIIMIYIVLINKEYTIENICKWGFIGVLVVLFWIYCVVI